MSGLMKNRGASSTKLNTSFEEQALKEITIANVNKSDKKRVEFVEEVPPQKSEKKQVVEEEVRKSVESVKQTIIQK